MQGRTRGFFEDIFVLVILVLLIWGGYMFFVSEDKNSISSPEKIVQAQSPNEQTQSYPVQQIDNLEKKEIKSVPTISIKTQKSEISANKKEQIEAKKQKSQNIVTKDEKVTSVIQEDVNPAVDIDKLQKFLLETKEKIKQKIVVDNKNNQLLSIRVTVLKNGSFEHLIHTGGSAELFKNNYQNIQKLFPLEIDKSIIGDFPRYLRYSYTFGAKEE